MGKPYSPKASEITEQFSKISGEYIGNTRDFSEIAPTRDYEIESRKITLETSSHV